MSYACHHESPLGRMLVTANAAHAYRGQVDRTVAIPYAGVDPETSSVSPVLFDVFVELLVDFIARA